MTRSFSSALLPLFFWGGGSSPRLGLGVKSWAETRVLPIGTSLFESAGADRAVSQRLLRGHVCPRGVAEAMKRAETSELTWAQDALGVSYFRFGMGWPLSRGVLASKAKHTECTF